MAQPECPSFETHERILTDRNTADLSAISIEDNEMPYIDHYPAHIFGNHQVEEVHGIDLASMDTEGSPRPTGPYRQASADHSQSSDSFASAKSASDDLKQVIALGLDFTGTEPETSPPRVRFPIEENEEEKPFHKWIKSLHKRGTQRRMTINGPLMTNRRETEAPLAFNRSRHQKSSSESSSGFVTAVKSASISLASLSIAPPSKNIDVSTRYNRTDLGSQASKSGRQSEDNSFIAKGVVADQGVTNRLLQRRHILEELIATEENYVADVKFLQHAYVNLMGSIPSLTSHLRASININLNEIIELHEHILGDLHRLVPYSEYKQADCISGSFPDTKATAVRNGHSRWKSLDAVPEYAGASLHKVPGMIAEPNVAAEVARAFGKKINRFFVYAEYGAKYEIMLKDVSTIHRNMSQWKEFDRGLEALATTLASLDTQKNVSNKALTVGDLLVKPLQRVCKYPLLFGQLLKYTPVCDCPHSHMEIESVLVRLRETTAQINRAADDPRKKADIERSWVLQDRLVFPRQSKVQSKCSVRSLGHVELCGVLYVSWQTSDAVDGQYFITILYRNHLILAVAARNEQVYSIQTCIGMNELKLEELDNGRGLQCHTAPFSWKLVFEADHQLFEITMSACSAKEETEWRRNLVHHYTHSTLAVGEEASMGLLALNVKPIGTVFGKPGTIARRMSIHRATTVGQMSVLRHVVIKNTTASKDVSRSSSSTTINRSQSLLATKRIPVLAPYRGERIRLENLLADVWTRESLPYPGMIGRSRGEHNVRSSASSIMRKLSVASIASNFSKRSNSIISITRSDDAHSADLDLGKGGVQAEPFLNEIRPDSDMEEVERMRQSDLAGVKENILNNSTGSSPIGTCGPAHPVSVYRGAAFLGRPLWAPDGGRILTPPLRTSSANGVAHYRASSMSTVKTTGDAPSDEEALRDLRKPIKWGKGKVKKSPSKIKAVTVKEGLRSLFR